MMINIKEAIKEALASEECSFQLKNMVKRAGGVENLTEERAERIARQCKLFTKVDPAQEAWLEYQNNYSVLEGLWRDIEDKEEGHVGDFLDALAGTAPTDFSVPTEMQSKIDCLLARNREIKDLAQVYQDFITVPGQARKIL